MSLRSFIRPRGSFLNPRIADFALPSGVLGPVADSHGRHRRIASACRAFCSAVHTRAMLRSEFLGLNEYSRRV